MLSPIMAWPPAFTCKKESLPHLPLAFTVQGNAIPRCCRPQDLRKKNYLPALRIGFSPNCDNSLSGINRQWRHHSTSPLWLFWPDRRMDRRNIFDLTRYV